MSHSCCPCPANQALQAGVLIQGLTSAEVEQAVFLKLIPVEPLTHCSMF